MASRYCVIIPALNAAATIGRLVQRIVPQHLDVVVVDDGSSDATAKVAAAQGAVVISHLKRIGKGGALRVGFRHAIRARYDGVITMDSDGQHDPSDLRKLIDAAHRERADIVLGNRMHNRKPMPIVRRWTNRAMSYVVSRLIRQRIPDSQCGFRFIRREVIAGAEFAANHFDLETELLLIAGQRGWRIASVPISTIYNNHSSYIRPVTDGIRFIRLVVEHMMSP